MVGLTFPVGVDKACLTALLYLSMRLELEVLDGHNKGKRIALKRGLVIGKTTANLTFADDLMADGHGVLTIDHKKSWNFECLAPNMLRIGSGEQPRALLMVGLVFHLGQTGFKVVEKLTTAFRTWEESLRDWLKHHPGDAKFKEFFFFLHPISLSFKQGPQYEEFQTLSYGPRFMGHDCLDINLKDPAIPKLVAKFFQIADECYIENLCGEKVLLNSKPFDQQPIQDGDILKINSTLIELSIQK